MTSRAATTAPCSGHLFCAAVGLILRVLGAMLVARAIRPMIDNLVASVHAKERALLEVKQLSGLLPICSSCKKIRVYRGSWRQIEENIRDRSGTDFSHGICSEYMPNLCRDFANDDSS